MEIGKMSQDYFEAVSVCELNQTTMSALGVKDGDPIIIETYEGSVIVHARLGRGLDPDTAFIPAGPYANVVIDADTSQSGMPAFKGVKVKIFKAENATVPSIQELLQSQE